MNILLLEDDFELANEILKFLKSKQFVCDVVHDGEMAVAKASQKQYDIILLDINVPGISGLEVCKQIRNKDKKISILMLTAYGEIDDKLDAFKKGADDYIVKPFHFDELLARINALYRRRENDNTIKRILQVKNLTIDLDEMQVKRDEIIIPLTPKEFKLLCILAEAQGRPLSKQIIADKLWDYHIETTQNTIEVYINFLRNKIDKNYTPKLIHTKVGFGYYLKEE